MIVIVDYDMGNVGSIQNMIKRIGYKSKISANILDIQFAERLILPGVGSFDEGMNNLKKLNLINILEEKVLREKTPILGICLGMQLLALRSEEGKEKGLGWVDAEVVKFSFNNVALKVPHMGWNKVCLANGNKEFEFLTNNTKYYFVHSYYMKCNEKIDELFHTHYGFNFISAIKKNAIMGAQFHPEKSHKFGMKYLKYFIEKF